jgi:hypothetical protein
MAGAFEESTVSCGAQSWSSQIILSYAIFLASLAFVFHVVADSNFSGILTLSAIAQCFAFVLLVLQVRGSGTASGISARGLALDALALCCRLSSTSWLLGYLPVDSSGDYLYQLTDLFSLTVITWLLYQVLFVKNETYDKDEDDFPVLPVVGFAVVCGFLFHADLNDFPLFDALWMIGLFISVLAAIPQLSLIAKAGGLTQAFTSHHVAALALSRILSGMYMWAAGEDITCHEWISGVNHAVVVVLGAHAVHLLLLADFMYFYLCSMASDMNGEFKLAGQHYV